MFNRKKKIVQKEKVSDNIHKYSGLFDSLEDTWEPYVDIIVDPLPKLSGNKRNSKLISLKCNNCGAFLDDGIFTCKYCGATYKRF